MYKLDYENNTMLMKACIYNLPIDEMKKLIKKYPREINKQNINGWSVLFEACYKGNLELTRVLIDEGADIDIRDENGEVAQYYAARNHEDDVYNYIEQIRTFKIAFNRVTMKKPRCNYYKHNERLLTLLMISEKNMLPREIIICKIIPNIFV